jgi:hypothetical protein
VKRAQQNSNIGLIIGIVATVLLVGYIGYNEYQKAVK